MHRIFTSLKAIKPLLLINKIHYYVVTKLRCNTQYKRDFITEQQIARHFVQYCNYLYHPPFPSMKLK